LCYAVAWQGYRTFYEAFNVTPQMAGISYQAIVAPAAISAFLLLLVTVGLTSLVAPVLFTTFIKIPVRTARLYLKSGLLVLALFWAWAIIRRPEHQPPPESIFVALFLVFGLVLVVAGLNEFVDRFRTRLWFRCRHAFRTQVLHRETRSIAHDYLISRRRARRRRGSPRRFFRQAGLIVRILPVFIGAFLVMVYIVYLGHAAEHAAHNVVAGKPNGGLDGYAAGILVKPTAVRVTVIAADTAFHSLENSRLLYLGRSDGAYVLYDIPSEKALIVPSGSIALEFGNS
jgi:hypothetical protein